MKCAIYVRTSTFDQHPEKQIDECKEYARAKGYDIHGIFSEHISGYKHIERPRYEEVKQLALRREIDAVIVWAIDRWVRNRDTLLDDIMLLRLYGCKFHSVKEAWLEAINIEGALGKTIQDFLLGIIGSLAEMESKRKSERVKMAHAAYVKENRKYRLWGRRALPDRIVDEVLELHRRGLSIRKISSEVSYYDKNSNLKNVSVGLVHKIISGERIVQKCQAEKMP